jgi:hypothetical protein
MTLDAGARRGSGPVSSAFDDGLTTPQPSRTTRKTHPAETAQRVSQPATRTVSPMGWRPPARMRVNGMVDVVVSMECFAPDDEIRWTAIVGGEARRDRSLLSSFQARSADWRLRYRYRRRHRLLLLRLGGARPYAPSVCGRGLCAVSSPLFWASAGPARTRRKQIVAWQRAHPCGYCDFAVRLWGVTREDGSGSFSLAYRPGAALCRACALAQSPSQPEVFKMHA